MGGGRACIRRSTPPFLPDGHQSAIIDPSPDPSGNTYSLQVMSTSGSVTTYGTASLQAETVPQLTLFDGTAGSVTIPSDATWHTVASSGNLPLLSSSEGTNCSTGANDCCSQHPSCIVYQCATSLSQVPHGTANVCTVPPAPEPTAFHFYTLTPCRVFDSRNPPNVPLPFNTPTQIPVGGVCGIPTSARAVALNVTVVTPPADVSVQIYPGNLPQPPVTNANSTLAGAVKAAFSVMPLATNGTGTVWVLPTASTSGSTNVVLDVAGYFE